MNEIVWQPKAKRQLKKIRERHIKKLLLDAVDTLIDYPNVAEVKDLKNHKYTHRLKVGTFRVLFNAFDMINIISIEEVKKRNERTYH